MDADRWKIVKGVMDAARDLRGAERGAFVAQACAHDEDLRQSVETLLHASDAEDGFLSVPAWRIGEDGPGAVAPGRRIGPYEVIREIGEGGMGRVYLAARADDTYRKNVAIKLVRGGLDTAGVIARFRQERQILASLEHPNIARLIDGGTADNGLPYFVLEYVEGVAIDAFCERRGYAVNQRIRLFLDVCEAVQYAHRNLVVHRDLKPGNILVTEEGVPKLLDFGIAKLLAPLPAAEPLDLTAASMRVMTPEYASPEQVRGEAVTTGTDIYSLGVILYRLLTGQRPYRSQTQSAGELERAICEEEPPKPSSLARHPPADGSRQSPERIGGDLDAILLMALRKEPERRYQSVEQLADDLRRHLSHVPVRARKDTFRYRAGKFVRRNRAVAAVTALLTLSLVGGLIGTTWAARIARAERARAERRFNDVRQLANSFLFEFHDAIQTLPGSTPARELVVRRALKYLDSLSREASGDFGLQRELATAYQKVGDVQGNPTFANLGDTAGSLSSHRRALSIRETLAARAPDDLSIRRELSTSHDRIGDLLWFQGDRGGALLEYRRALGIRELLWANRRDNVNAHLLCTSCNNIGDSLSELKDADGALASYRRGLAVAEEAARMNAGEARAQRDLSVSHNRMGDALWYANQMAEALEHYREALGIRQALASHDPSNAVFRRDVMSSYNNLADTLIRLNRRTEALETYGKAMAISASLAAADPRNAQAGRDLAVSHRNVGLALLEDGRRGPALRQLRLALDALEPLAARDPGSAVLRRDVQEVRAAMANAGSKSK